MNIHLCDKSSVNPVQILKLCSNARNRDRYRDSAEKYCMKYTTTHSATNSRNVDAMAGSIRLVFTLIVAVAWSAVAFGQATPTPGDGWPDEMPNMPAVGAEGQPGYQATAIARWNVVPHQTFDDKFEIGVVAFHINGIERVALAVEGGEWVDITEMTFNPRTRTWEYWATLDADQFTADQEGPVEVRAVVHPRGAGRPRVLAGGSETQVDRGDGSMIVVVDKGGLQHPKVWVGPDGDDEQGDGTEDNPFRTIDGALDSAFRQQTRPWEADTSGVLDGATIYLMEGEYAGPGDGYYYDMQRWATITAAPDADPSEVRLTSNGGRSNIQLLRLANITWKPAYNQSLIRPNRPGRNVWFDGVTGIGGDRDTFGNPWVNGAETYYTDTIIRNFTQGVDTWNGQPWLIRHVTVEHIHEDAFRMEKLLLNSSLDDSEKFGTKAHPDIVQISGGLPDNVIIFNLKATRVGSQGIYMRGEDWAVVNVFIDRLADYDFRWQIDKVDKLQHALIWHCATINQMLHWRTGEATRDMRDISVRNNAFHAMNAGRDSRGQHTDIPHLIEHVMTIDNNHFTQGAFHEGTNATTGPLSFVDAPAHDYRPDTDSPLLGRVEDELLIPCDIDNNPRTLPAAIGPFSAPQTD